MSASAKTKIGGNGSAGGNVWLSAAAPTADNDITDGIHVGDTWVKTDGTVYRCVDKTDTAAVWKKQVPSTTITALTNSTGGTADNTVAAVGATNSGDVSATINNNFADLTAKVNLLIAAMA